MECLSWAEHYSSGLVLGLPATVPFLDAVYDSELEMAVTDAEMEVLLRVSRHQGDSWHVIMTHTLGIKS